ncbi:hypothetical protein LCGC14_2810660, partial [marine sediment metagenome]
DETRFYRIMLAYIIQNGSKKPFKHLKMRNLNLDPLNSPYYFTKILKAYGDINIHTFDDKELILSNVFLRKLFKADEEKNRIHYSNDLEPSDLEENFISHLFDIIFPNLSRDTDAMNEFKRIFYWRVDFTEAKLEDFEADHDLLRKYLEKKEIRLVSKTITDIRDSIMEYINALLTLKETYLGDSDIFEFFSFLKNDLIIEERKNKKRFTVSSTKIRIDSEEYEEFTESHIKELLMDYLKAFKISRVVQKKHPYIINIDLHRFNDILSLKVPEVGKIELISPTDLDIPTSTSPTPTSSTPTSSTPTSSIPTSSIPTSSIPTSSTPSTGNIKRGAVVRINKPIGKFPKKSDHPKKITFSKESRKIIEKKISKKELIDEYKSNRDAAEELLRSIYSGPNHEVGVPCQICR